MKPLLILTRIIFVGCFWSIFFLEGIRVIMLRNWRFDIFNSAHWHHAWDLWLGGWVIDDPKEWAFVLIILTFIPLWLTGWAALSLIAWGDLSLKIALFPGKIFKNLFYKPVKIIAKTAGVNVLKKKKSYKEIRPRNNRAPISDYNDQIRPSLISSGTAHASAPSKRRTPGSRRDEPEANTSFNHSLFKFDETAEDDFEFDFDSFDKKTETPAEKEKPAEKEESKTNNNTANNNKNKNNNRDKKGNAPRNDTPTPTAPQQRSGGNSSMDVLKQKGYEVLTGTTVKNSLIDFIGISDKQICICLLDKEPGDWLADEERFNDEEPLWFSESSHRISPVRKIDIARKILNEKLSESDMSFDIKAYVIVQIGNIINAEDMFETWDEMNICVARIDRGTPKELKLFSKTLEEGGSRIDKEKFEKVKKIIRSIA